MAALISSIDSITSMTVGERGHLQYGWSNNIKEKIVQFNFQLVRTANSTQLQTLSDKFKEILTEIHQLPESNNFLSSC